MYLPRSIVIGMGMGKPGGLVGQVDSGTDVDPNLATHVILATCRVWVSFKDN
jgi:hypothetical protein